MNEATKDFILLCIVGYVIWVLLAMLWFRFVNWWKKRFSKTHKKYFRKKYPHKTLTSDDILGKSRYNIQEVRAKQQAREQQYQRQEEERQERAKKEEMRIQALASEMAKEMVKEEMRLPPPPSEEPPERYPRVIPVEELDAVFANEEVLPDYSMPDKSDKMMVTDSATTIDELKNVVTVLKHKEVTTTEQQQEAVRVIAKIDNTLLLEQMLSQIDGSTKYASELIEKHYTEQLTPHPKPQIEGFDMGKYLNY